MCLALFLEIACSNISSSSFCSRSYFLFGFLLGLAFDTSLQITLLLFSFVVGIGGVDGFFQLLL